ncbi:MAG: AMP-binding protein [Firmicutes bacterium]|nr:AMP-binding protein [Bacillota bacterium]
MTNLDNYGRMTIGELLDRSAGRYPHNEALVFPGTDTRYTYRQMQQACNRAAKGLMALGVRRGEHIAVMAPNVPEWVLTQFAAAKVGAVLVTANTNYTLFEMEYLLRHSDVNTLVFASKFRDTDYLGMVRQLCPEMLENMPGRLNCKKLPMLKNLVLTGGGPVPGLFAWEEMLAAGDDISDQELAARQAFLQPDEVISIQYTTGITGFPKGVMLSHANLVKNAIDMAGCMNLGPDDRLCLPVPLFHTFGCVLGTLTCVSASATMVIPEYFNPVRVLEALEKERCTALHGVPTMFITELEVLENHYFNTSSLRTGIMSGAPCPPDLIRVVAEKTGMREIVVTYGQAEASPGITMSRFDEPLEVRMHTVGRPLDGVEVKIADPATGDDVPPGAQGEICARGYNIMKGYYKMPEATTAAIDEQGWLHTGDLGVMDADGYLRVTGRIKDVIIRGGENIYPREIEEFLSKHPGIKDVQVVGVPSEKYGEEVMAFIQPHNGAEVTIEEIRKYCIGRIARYKIPAHIQLVDGYPTAASGKVQKHRLRELGLKKLSRHGLAVN